MLQVDADAAPQAAASPPRALHVGADAVPVAATERGVDPQGEWVLPARGSDAAEPAYCPQVCD